MNPIQTDEEIIEWARMVVAANGEKYTPITKGDQFAIAKYILTLCSPSKVDNGDETKGPEGGGDTPESTKGEVIGVDNPELINPKADWAQVRKGATSAEVDEARRMENGEKGIIRRELLVKRGIDTPQKAFDEFLKYTERHHEEMKVIDFSNGMQSTAAAFSWWLTQRID